LERGAKALGNATKPAITLPRSEFLQMIRPLHSRAMSCMAAVAICMCVSPTPVRAESDAPPDHTRQAGLPEQEKASAPDFGPQTARATAEAARRYAEIAASGGWPRIAKPLGPDARGKPVLELRRRLAAEDFLAREDMNEPVWDAKLEDAVKRFQAHTGLEQTGTVSRATLRELNAPAAARARQLEATAKRLSKMKFSFGERYVAVNIAAAAVESVENGKRIERYDAIVGGRKHRSPQIVTKIVSIDVNPTWTVPASIVKKELAPKLRRNPSYLAREHIRVLDARGREINPRKLLRLSVAHAARFTFRQDPGPKNSLGSIRISMPNKEQVFMHDTPRKELFDREYRFLSHGCVRVEGVYDLASWLLRGIGERRQWDEAELRDKVDEGKTEKIKLPRLVPVAWVYMTGWASPDGATYFRRDIYSLDKGTKLRGPSS
jgi:murein L,D-transpeptidase YcbB/YkuD